MFDEFMALLGLVMVFVYGAILGLLLGAVVFNKWMKRSIAWRMGRANNGFVFYVGAGREGKLFDWDTREPFWTHGQETFAIDPANIIKIQNIPCVIINRLHGRTIPVELPHDATGLFNPAGVYANFVLMKELIEAKLALKAKKWQDMALLAAAIGGSLGLIVIVFVFLGQGDIKAVADSAAQSGLHLLNQTRQMWGLP